MEIVLIPLFRLCFEEEWNYTIKCMWNVFIVMSITLKITVKHCHRVVQTDIRATFTVSLHLLSSQGNGGSLEHRQWESVEILTGKMSTLAPTMNGRKATGLREKLLPFMSSRCEWGRACLLRSRIITTIMIPSAVAVVSDGHVVRRERAVGVSNRVWFHS